MAWTKESWDEVGKRYSACWSQARMLMHGIPAAGFGVHHLLPWWWLDGTHWHRWDGALCADPGNVGRGGNMTGLGPNNEVVFNRDRAMQGGDPLSYLLRVDRAHPLPKPIAMPGQTWAVPADPGGTMIFAPASLAPGAQAAALLSGPTPRGRDLPWADLASLAAVLS